VYRGVKFDFAFIAVRGHKAGIIISEPSACAPAGSLSNVMHESLRNIYECVNVPVSGSMYVCVCAPGGLGLDEARLSLQLGLQLGLFCLEVGAPQTAGEPPPADTRANFTEDDVTR